MPSASRPSAFQPIGKEFEPFLYAVVRDENSGAPLTMISVIARSGADPWLEAARISQLPMDTALRVVERMIEDCSSLAREESDGHATSTRLLALLSVSASHPAATLAETEEGGTQLVIILALFAGLMLASVAATMSNSSTEVKNPEPFGAWTGMANKQPLEPRNEISSNVRRD